MKLGNIYLSSIAASALVLASCGDGNDGSQGDTGTDGSNAAVALIKSTTLPSGDAHCPAGGTQVDLGLDNGDGGGTAGNATLEAGEVDDTKFACNGATTAQVDSLSLPEGAAGAFFVNTKGGSSTAAASVGGNGGEVYIAQSYGTNGGHVKVAKTGTVDVGFTAPAMPASSNYGPTPLVVTGITHVKRVTNLSDTTDVDGGALAAGDIVEANSVCNTTATLYRWNSTASADQISGVHVQSGATLTFNHTTAGACVDYNVLVPNTVRNEGVITAGADASGNSDNVSLRVGSYVGAAGSSFALKGTSGGKGGHIYINADRLADDNGAVWNFGTMDSSGGSGTNGGVAGPIEIRAGARLINTGTLTAKGGDATSAAGTAGNGGFVVFRCFYGENANSGTIDSSGGNGGTTAGDAAAITVSAYDFGIVRNSGELRAIGGTPTAGCAATCSGGDGGNVSVEAYVGDIYHAANISAYGGSGLTGTGGEGGHIEVYAEDEASLQTGNENSTLGSVWLSGNMDTHGGDGAAAGGDGGYFNAYTDLPSMPFGQGLYLYGYGGGINASGGNGDATGGNGSELQIIQAEGENSEGQYTPGGSIITTVDVVTKGGNAANGVGGYGGAVTMSTNRTKLVGTDFEKLITSGTVDTSGGNGTSSGNYSGYVYLYGMDGAENHGAITANGGSASAAAGVGGYTYSFAREDEGDHTITLTSDAGPVVNSGNLSCVGGAATGSGGSGGISGGILVFGITTDNSGTLTANGGNGDTATGAGGNGGQIAVRASTGASTNTAASMSATGGTGAAGSVGAPGVIIIDGHLL